MLFLVSWPSALPEPSARTVGLYELLIKDEVLNTLIIERASVDEIRHAAIDAGMTTLLQEGIQMVFSGRTDFKQVLRVCSQ